jgi:hypothetical protein
MTMSISLQYTWYDAYQDPALLAAVQAVLDAHQPPGVQLNWETLLAAVSGGAAETFLDMEGTLTFLDMEGTFVGVAESSLIAEPEAIRGDPLDVVPMDFVGAALDLAAAGRPRWRLYPAQRVLDRWRQHGAAHARTQRQLEQLYYEQQPTRSDAWPETRQEMDAVVAHAQLAIVRLAQSVLRYQVPCRLFT